MTANHRQAPPALLVPGDPAAGAGALPSRARFFLGITAILSSAPEERSPRARPRSSVEGRPQPVDVASVLRRGRLAHEALDIGSGLSLAALLPEDLAEVEEGVPLLRVQLDRAFPV